jgi:hypothetical protein
MDLLQVWPAQTVMDHFEGGMQWEPMVHTAGAPYSLMGLQGGERVFVVHVGVDDSFDPGVAYLVGRITALSREDITGEAGDTSGVVSFEEAVAVFDDEDLWRADEHVIGAVEDAVPADFLRVIPPDVLRRLELVAPDGAQTGLDVGPDGRVAPQELGDVRGLTPASADLLDEVLRLSDDDMPRRREQDRLGILGACTLATLPFACELALASGLREEEVDGAIGGGVLASSIAETLADHVDAVRAAVAACTELGARDDGAPPLVVPGRLAEVRSLDVGATDDISEAGDELVQLLDDAGMELDRLADEAADGVVAHPAAIEALGEALRDLVFTSDELRAAVGLPRVMLDGA